MINSSMFNYRTKAILKREIREQIFTKKFVIMTLSFPLIMLLMIGLQAFIVTFGGDEKSNLHILNESAEFQTIVQNRFDDSDSDFDDESLFQLHYELSASDDVETYIDDHREALLDDEITGVVFIPDSAYEDKQVYYYSINPANQNLQGRLREYLNQAFVGNYFNELNLDTSAIEYARSNIDVEGIRVTENDLGSSAENLGNLIVAGILSFLMYMSLLMMGPMVMGVVNEEKTNRVVEVLLSSVTPTELMFAKVMGTAISGLTQMAIWIAPLILLALGALPAIAMFGGLELQVEGFSIFYFLLNYLLSLLIFLSIFAAFGAMFDTPQDAQNMMTPVIFMIIIPFFVAMSMVRNPANILAEVCSMLPFFSLIIMPARMTLIDVPMWQMLVAIVVNVATFYYCIQFGAKIYRVTILMTGKKPGWKEMIKWLRYE